MTFHLRRKIIRICGSTATSALAMILVAAGLDIDQNTARLHGLPKEQRLKLIENLRRFDLVLKPEEQRSLRDIDRRIAELPPAQQVQYLSAIRRYYNWLNHLPEKHRDELLDLPPGERMPMILKLIAGNNPVPKVETGKFLQIADLGEFSPFELAAIFKIWQLLTPNQRQGVEKKPGNPQRVEELFRMGKPKGIEREIKPEAFDEEKWVSDTEAYLREKRPALFLGDLKNKAEARRIQIMRRHAINFYFLDKKQVAVNSDRLAAFVAAFPPFIQSSFEQYPPDEARRRLTIVYRLVFPPGEEMKAVPAAAAAVTGAQPATSKKGGGSKPTGESQKAPGGSPF